MDISGGRNHLVVVTEDGNAVAWGGNENNQAKVPAKATNIAKLASGYYQNCIIKEDGSVVTWGLKGYLLGTDNLGRNVFYRILKGGQMTMTVGFIAVIIQFAIGILVGVFPDTTVELWISFLCVWQRLSDPFRLSRWH